MYILLQTKFDASALFSAAPVTGKALLFRTYADSINAQIEPFLTKEELNGIRSDFRGAAERRSRNKVYLKLDDAGTSFLAAQQVINDLAGAALAETGTVMKNRPKLPTSPTPLP